MSNIAIFSLGCFVGFNFGIMVICLMKFAKNTKDEQCDCCAPECGEFRTCEDYKPKLKKVIQP